MSKTTLVDVKAHLRVEITDEDDLIQSFIDAAEAHIDAYCVPETAYTEYPAPLAAAVKLLVGDMYENREAQSAVQLYRNKTVDYLMAPYITVTT